MSRISRLVVLVTSVVALVGATAGTASAITWDVSGTGAFHATAPGSTLSTTGSSFSCPAGTASGTYTAGAFAGALYSGVSGSLTYGGCVLVGQSVEMSCAYKLTGATQPAATVVTGVVDLTCGMILSNGTKLCHLEGAPHAVYSDNPAPSLDTLNFTTSQLRISGTSCVLGSNDVAHLGAFTMTVVSAGGGPHIVRTA